MELLQELIQLNEKTIKLQQEIKSLLAESVVEYFSTVLGHLKTKEYHDLYNKDAPLINVDQLASLIAGIKILADHEIRSTLTVDDIKINPNNSMQLYNILNSIPKNGKGTPKLTLDVFKALSEVSPKHFAQEREAMKALKSKNEAERKKAISELESVAEKVSKLFNKVYSIAHGEDES